VCEGLLVMGRKLCVEVDELRDRTDYLERVLDKYGMYRMDGRCTFRGATWELSDTHFAVWAAATTLPLDATDTYARLYGGGLEIRGGAVDIHTGEGNERVEIDGAGIRGYTGGVESFDLDAATGILTATGVILSGTISSANYVSNVSGWKIDNAGRAEFQDAIVRGELHCAVFVKDMIDARAGTMIIAKSAGTLFDDVAVPAAGTWLIYVNDPPTGAAFLFENADECQIRTEYATGVRQLWFTVSARNDMGDGRQRYTCTYTGGIRNVTYYAGCPVIDYGVAGQGLLRMTAEAAFNGPHFEVLTTAGAPWIPDFTVHGRFGNLNGIYGYAADTYGVGIGAFGVADYITVDATNGIRFFDVANDLRAQLTSGNWTLGNTATEHLRIEGTKIQIKDGATVHTDISAGNVTVGEVGPNLSNVYITAGALQLRDNITIRIGLSAGGILTVNDSGGNPVITLDAALGAEITKKLTMPGASSAISIGAVPPTGSGAGTGIWIDRTGMYGLDTNALQAKFDAVTGAITAGAGAVILDINGIGIVASAIAESPTSITWASAATRRARISAFRTALNNDWLYIAAGPADNTYISFSKSAASSYIKIVVDAAMGGKRIDLLGGNVYIPEAVGIGITPAAAGLGTGDVAIAGGFNVGTAVGAGVAGVWGASAAAWHPQWQIKNTHADAGAGILWFLKDGGSPADDDAIGVITFDGKDSGDNDTRYADIYVYSTDVTHGTEDSKMVFGTMMASVKTDTAWFESGKVYNAANDTHWDQVSDEVLKHHIVPVSKALASLRLLEPINFRFNEKFLETNPTADLSRIHAGFTAQNFAKVFPEYVVTTGKYLSMNTSGLDALLVASIQELEARVIALEALLSV